MNTFTTLPKTERHYIVSIFLLIASIVGFSAQLVSMIKGGDVHFNDWFTLTAYVIFATFFSYRILTSAKVLSRNF